MAKSFSQHDQHEYSSIVYSFCSCLEFAVFVPVFVVRADNFVSKF